MLDRVEDIKRNKNIPCLPKTDILFFLINIYYKYKNESTKIKWYGFRRGFSINIFWMGEWPLSGGGGIWNDIWKWVECEHAETRKAP